MPDHGAIYSGNKCILPKSLNIGNVGDGIVPALVCPGKGGVDSLFPWNEVNDTTNTWPAQCGISFSANQYYTSDPAATTVNCNCTQDPTNGYCITGPREQPTFAEWQDTLGNDKGSTLGMVPTDEELLGWARAKLGMPPKS